MNCPNCGGILDLKERHCEYCDTTFTEAELNPSKEVDKETKTEETQAQPQRKKTLTERRQEEIAKEKANRPHNGYDTGAREMATGAAIMGIFGLFSGVRRFFRELKRTVCFLFLIALEVGFGYVMISGVASNLFETDIQNFVLQNAIILVNALLAGIICRIGRIRAGTALVAIVNLLAVVWVFIYPLIATNFEGVTPQTVAVLAVVEMAVLALSVLFAHLIYRR